MILPASCQHSWRGLLVMLEGRHVLAPMLSARVACRAAFPDRPSPRWPLWSNEPSVSDSWSCADAIIAHEVRLRNDRHLMARMASIPAKARHYMRGRGVWAIGMIAMESRATAYCWGLSRIVSTQLAGSVGHVNSRLEKVTVNPASPNIPSAVVKKAARPAG